MKAWRAIGAEFGVHDRKITIFEVSSEKTL